MMLPSSLITNDENHRSFPLLGRLLTRGRLILRSQSPPRKELSETSLYDTDTTSTKPTVSTVDSTRSVNLSLEEDFARLKFELRNLTTLAEKRLEQKTQANEAIHDLEQELQALGFRKINLFQRREHLLDEVDITTLSQMTNQKEHQRQQYPTIQQLLLHRDLALHHVEIAYEELERERGTTLDLLEKQQEVIGVGEGEIEYTIRLFDLQDSIKDLECQLENMKERISKIQEQRREERQNLRQKVHSMRLGRSPSRDARDHIGPSGAISEDNNGKRLDHLRKEVYALREQRTQSMTLPQIKVESMRARSRQRDRHDCRAQSVSYFEHESKLGASGGPLQEAELIARCEEVFRIRNTRNNSFRRNKKNARLVKSSSPPRRRILSDSIAIDRVAGLSS